MKMLTQIKFTPPDSGTLYFAEGIFRGHHEIAFADLPSEQQSDVEDAMAWLAAMAAQYGFVEISQVYLRRLADIQLPPADPEDETEESVFSPAFVADITGRNESGLIGSETIPSVPGPETTAMAVLWDLFEAQINGN